MSTLLTWCKRCQQLELRSLLSQIPVLRPSLLYLIQLRRQLRSTQSSRRNLYLSLFLKLLRSITVVVSFLSPCLILLFLLLSLCLLPLNLLLPLVLLPLINPNPLLLVLLLLKLLHLKPLSSNNNYSPILLRSSLPRNTLNLLVPLPKLQFLQQNLPISNNL